MEPISVKWKAFKVTKAADVRRDVNHFFSDFDGPGA
jgi:hypothetical protein